MNVSCLERSAEISECGRYRWSLRRRVSNDNDLSVCFVMLNPSTADGLQDDPTIRRCIGFAKSWGYGILEVRNLFPWRATKKRELLKADNPTGDPRGLAELGNAHKSDLMIAAWGTWVPFDRDLTIKLLYRRGRPIYCLKVLPNGRPQHPLFVPADQHPVPYWNCVEQK